MNIDAIFHISNFIKTDSILENHRTQSIYESNLTTKLFIFYFANCFMCLFYEAFVLMNFNSLSQVKIFAVNIISIFGN